MPSPRKRRAKKLAKARVVNREVAPVVEVTAAPEPAPEPTQATKPKKKIFNKLKK